MAGRVGRGRGVVVVGGGGLFPRLGVGLCSSRGKLNQVSVPDAADTKGLACR